MLTFALLCCAIAFALQHPGTPAGRAARHYLVEAPVKRFGHVSWAVTLFWLAVLVGIALVVDVMGKDGVQLLAMTLPEFLAWYVAFDVAVYIDVLAAAWTLAAVARIWTQAQNLTSPPRRVMRRIANAVRRATRRRAAKRSTPPKRTGQPANDNEADPYAAHWMGAAA